jgi:hypothetical protein
MGIKEIHEYTAAELNELQRSENAQLISTVVFYGMVCISIFFAVSALVVVASLVWDTVQRRRYMKVVSNEKKVPKKKWG